MSFLGATFRTIIIDRQAKKLTLAQLLADLGAGSEKVNAALRSASDSPVNRNRMAHIIGIERWGQSRLRAFLGEPVAEDEYEGYRPAESLRFAELGDTFGEVREQTLQIGQELADAGIPLTDTAPHNQLGAMPLASWLYYLNMHANLEAIKMR